MGYKEDRRRKLKRQLFQRDGWQDSSGEWFVMCAMGCGDIIGWYTSIMAKKSNDGLRTLDNTLLVCDICHRAGCNYTTLPPSERPKRRRNTGHTPTPPKTLSVSENIDRLERLNQRRRESTA